MSVYKYEIINPVTNRKKPFIDNRGFLIIPNAKRKYKYYVIGAQYNPNKLAKEYFILFGFEKFDENCRRCRLDDYCRFKLVIKGEVKDYIVREIKDRGNIDCKYLESEENYDVYLIE